MTNRFFLSHLISRLKLCLQPLTVTTASLTMAENLADLIDGYCRLISNESHSFIVRVQKGEALVVHSFRCVNGLLSLKQPDRGAS